MNAAAFKPAFYFRRMSEVDVASVLGIEHMTYTHPWTAGNFHDSIRCGYHCWMLEKDHECQGNECLGYGIMSVAVGEAHIMNLTISPLHLRQGLGRSLLKFLLAQAKVFGAESVFLDVRASNTAAYQLYASQGFNEVGLRRNYYLAGKTREDAIIMALEI
jgi:ribosomal-protein-alanine N-acetyltransferase